MSKVIITLTPDEAAADPGDDTGLTAAAYEAIHQALAEIAEEFDIEGVRE